jgi:hypothetical protein
MNCRVKWTAFLAALIRQFRLTCREVGTAAEPVYINVQRDNIKNSHCRCMENRLHAQLVLNSLHHPPLPRSLYFLVLDTDIRSD